QQFAAEYMRQAFAPWKWNGNWKWKWKWKWRSNSALFLIRGHHGRFYPSCRTSPGTTKRTTKLAGARDHRATYLGAHLHPQHPQEGAHRIRNRRNGNGEWSELAIRQRYPLDRTDYRGPADH